LHFVDQASDIALLKADFEPCRSWEEWDSADGFPFIPVTVAPVEEGEPVYAYGFPLSMTDEVHRMVPGVTSGPGVIGTSHQTRVTSAIVASAFQEHGPVRTSHDPIRYVLDKPLNPGNSGGPIVRVESGEAFAVCHAFQTMAFPQPPYGKDESGR